MPMRGIELLKKAIQKIQINEAQLTSIHADLCQLCLLAKCFKTALPFLDTDITSISQEVISPILFCNFSHVFINQNLFTVNLF